MLLLLLHSAVVISL